MSDKKSITIFPWDFRIGLSVMSDADAGKVFKAICDVECEMTDTAKPVFFIISEQINRVDTIKSERREAGKIGGLAKASKTKQKLAKSTSLSHSHSLSLSLSKKKNTNTVFVPPGFEEVAAYLAEKYPSINARQFYDHYAVADWKDVKGLPVLNWKQRAVGWASRDNGSRQKKPIMAPAALPDGWTRDEWGNEYYEGDKKDE